MAKCTQCVYSAECIFEEEGVFILALRPGLRPSVMVRIFLRNRKKTTWIGDYQSPHTTEYHSMLLHSLHHLQEGYLDQEIVGQLIEAHIIGDAVFQYRRYEQKIRFRTELKTIRIIGSFCCI